MMPSQGRSLGYRVVEHDQPRICVPRPSSSIKAMFTRLLLLLGFLLNASSGRCGPVSTTVVPQRPDIITVFQPTSNIPVIVQPLILQPTIYLLCSSMFSPMAPAAKRAKFAPTIPHSARENVERSISHVRARREAETGAGPVETTTVAAVDTAVAAADAGESVMVVDAQSPSALMEITTSRSEKSAADETTTSTSDESTFPAATSFSQPDVDSTTIPTKSSQLSLEDDPMSDAITISDESVMHVEPVTSDPVPTSTSPSSDMPLTYPPFLTLLPRFPFDYTFD